MRFTTPPLRPRVIREQGAALALPLALDGRPGDAIVCAARRQRLTPSVSPRARRAVQQPAVPQPASVSACFTLGNRALRSLVLHAAAADSPRPSALAPPVDTILASALTAFSACFGRPYTWPDPVRSPQLLLLRTAALLHRCVCCSRCTRLLLLARPPVSAWPSLPSCAPAIRPFFDHPPQSPPSTVSTHVAQRPPTASSHRALLPRPPTNAASLQPSLPRVSTQRAVCATAAALASRALPAALRCARASSRPLDASTPCSALLWQPVRRPPPAVSVPVATLTRAPKPRAPKHPAPSAS
ncbi:hypothetical protein C7974DRAFT_417068 [Boeremia exigua]|uniref:uncharacterized protein n=1 Tax=Boeremia exigua TaxID=749465 RepID=UPI001E8E4554|nr:uncharacterized protein C7974DRAFT_417068 [Boeremia exigua]KAH6614854.1 hypothetical protein C7974DRAFT_417068 [Boeremia exigua]